MIGLVLLACDPGLDTGSERVLLSDDDLVALAAVPSFTPLYVAAAYDAGFDWTAVTTDWLGRPFSAATETYGVEFIRAQDLSPEELALALVRDDLTQDMVELYGWELGNGPYSSARVSEFDDHTPALSPSHLTPGDPFLLVLRDVHESVRLAVLVEGSESVASSRDDYLLVDGMGTLAVTAALDATPVPLGDGDQLDWHQLTASSAGGRFDSANATFMASVPLAGGGSATWDELASLLDGADSVPTGGEVRVDAPLPIAAATPGDRFLVALDCDHCEPLFPAAMFIAERR